MNKTQRLVIGGLFCALGVLLPQAFHIFGLTVGQTFLPMHIPAIIAGFILGPVYGLIVGILSPILSCFITAMPPLAKMPFMAIEIGVYGLCSGLFYLLFSRKIKSAAVSMYISLILAQISGRIVNALCTAAFMVFVGKGGFFQAAVGALASAAAGIPGIIIQLVFIPALSLMIIKVFKLYGGRR